VRGELPPRRHPWFYDNGAFRDHRADRQFDAARFEADLALLAGLGADWLAVPDVVSAGLTSLDFSNLWLNTVRKHTPTRAYLVVQDGMSPQDVLPVAGRYDGLFVGGSVEWKVRTGKVWVDAAHRAGLPCHIGRVGTPKRVMWAKRIGADSIDSCLPLWSAENLDRFVSALDGRQMELF
jgi:hypothetical protein